MVSALFSQPARLGLALIALVSTLGMAGCGVDLTTANAPVAMPGTVIEGNVHGGVFPIQNATIRLMETQSNGYGGAAKQLAQTTSNSAGYFNMPYTPASGTAPASWTCDSNQFAYITVTGGHTATNTPNYNVAQIGVIGNCGQVLNTSSEINNVQVFVSELSTIAAAYTLRSFISIDNTNAATGQQMINISAPANNNASTGACTQPAATKANPVPAYTCVSAGLAHGFANAYNLVDSVNYSNVLPSGQARLSVPSNGNAYVPQAEINTLGNILQSCVDSPGGTVGTYSGYTPGGTGSTRCGDLFYWTTPPGSTTAPTNTLQAAMNMAQYPANNVSSLYSLQPNAVFFTPDLTAQPNDLAVSVVYPLLYFGASSGALDTPVGLSLGANDDVYVLAASAPGTSNTQTAVLGLYSYGQVKFSGPVNTTYLNPTSIAVDVLEDVWVTNDSTSSGALLKVNSGTGAITVGTTLASAAGVATDKFADVWASVDSSSANSILAYTAASLTGGAVTPALQSNPFRAPLLHLSVDGSGDFWGLSTTGTTSAAVLFPNKGTASSPNYGNAFKSQSLNSTAGFAGAPTASGTVYFPLAGEIDNASYSGNNVTANSPSAFTGKSQSSTSAAVPNQSEVDGGGNLFYTDAETSGRLYEYVPAGNTDTVKTTNSGGTSTTSYQVAALLPCYPVNQQCYVPASFSTLGVQVDSSGAVWYLANTNYEGYGVGVLVQTFGPGTATWPVLALEQPGAMPQ